MVFEINEKNEKRLIMFACLFGFSGIAYGIARENDFIFISGILAVIAAYLLIRRKLKKTVGREE